MELTNILLGVCLTFILYNSFYKWIDKGWVPNTEPFNCSFCISFWVFIGFYLVSLQVGTIWFEFERYRIDLPIWIIKHEPTLLVIPLGYHIVNKLINRL